MFYTTRRGASNHAAAHQKFSASFRPTCPIGFGLNLHEVYVLQLFTPTFGIHIQYSTMNAFGMLRNAVHPFSFFINKLTFFSSILFFARPKKSIQKKRRPASRFSLRFSKRAGPFRTRPLHDRGLKQRKGLFPPVSAMLGAGRWGSIPYWRCSFSFGFRHQRERKG